MLGPTVLSVAVDGTLYRVHLAGATTLADVKARVRAAVGPVAELRCAQTGILIRSAEDLRPGEDHVIASREEYAAMEVPPASVPLATFAQAVGFARVAPHLVVLGGTRSVLPGSSAFVVALSAGQAALLHPRAVGQRWVLHVGHEVGEAGGLSLGGALAASWSVTLDRLGAHPSLLQVYSYTVCAPPGETLPSLPDGVRAGLAGGPGRGVPLLLTEAYTHVEGGGSGTRLSLGVLCGLALDLCRALVHLQGVRCAHRGIRPGAVVVGAGQRTALLAGLEDVVPLPLGSAGGGGMLLRVPDDAGHAALLGPAPEYEAPEVHACAHARVALPGGVGRVIPYGKAGVWSVGTTLATLALGRHPWPSYPRGQREAVGVLAASSSTPLTGPACPPGVLAEALAPFLPPPLLTLLRYMTRQDPGQRITAKAALLRLMELANGQPGVSLPAPLPPDSHAVPPAPAFAVPGVWGGEGDAHAGSAMAVEEAEGDAQAATGGSLARRGESKESEEEGKEEGVEAGGVIILQVVGVDGRGATPASPAPVAVLHYAGNDGYTVSVLLARACQLIDSPHPSPLMSLLWEGGRVDPAAPVWRLPTALRSAGSRGRVLGMAAGLAASAPTVVVPTFGVAAIPPPPPFGPTGCAHLGHVGGGGGLSGIMAGLRADGGGPLRHAAPSHPPSAAAHLPPPDRQVEDRPPAPPLPAHHQVATEVSPHVNVAFSPTLKSPQITLLDECVGAVTTGTWGAVALHDMLLEIRPNATYSVSIQVAQCETGAGLAVGYYDPATFDPTSAYFGHSKGSWAYSRTGKASDSKTAEWADYGEVYGVGDVLTLEVDCVSTVKAAVEQVLIRFFKNGLCQGTAFVLLPEAGAGGGGGSRAPAGPSPLPRYLIPGVTMGSNTGGRTVRVIAEVPEVRNFDPFRSHYRILLGEDRSKVHNVGKWATVLAAHPGVKRGRLSWSVRVEETKNGAGVAVGVVDLGTFDYHKQNLGASVGSWCYSKTGKKGDGNGTFVTYGKPFQGGDILTCTLDMDAQHLSFAVNGEDQGVAFKAEHGIGRGGRPLIPAVCIGSTEGEKMARASIVAPKYTPTKFSTVWRNPKVLLSDALSSAETRDKWGTVYVDYPPIRAGRFSFAVQVTSAGQGCGAAVGFAAMGLFDPVKRNLGAHAGSWCYSKTGKFSGSMPSQNDEAKLAAFSDFGSPFKTGDVVSAEVDVEREEMQFYLNGTPVNRVPRSCPGIRSALEARRFALKPAVVLGSGEGGHFTKLTLCAAAVTRFDPSRSNKHLVMDDADRRVKTDSRWCTTLVDSPGVTIGGVLRFAVRIDGEGGAAVGFAEASAFRVQSQNLGASPGTWAVSKTGKKSCGGVEGFQAFSEKFKEGDTIGAEVDMNDGTIRFWKNGSLLGTAFHGLKELGDAPFMPRPPKPITLVPAVCLGSNNGGKPAVAQLVEFNPAWLQ